MLTIVIFINITQPTHPFFWFSQHLAIYQVYSLSPLPEMDQLFMSPKIAQGNWNFSRWIPQWDKSDKWQSWGWVQVYWSQNIFLVTWVGLIQPPFYSLQKDLKKKKNHSFGAMEQQQASRFFLAVLMTQSHLDNYQAETGETQPFFGNSVKWYRRNSFHCLLPIPWSC